MKYNNFDEWINNRSWLECRYTLRNCNTNMYAEHPLFILDAIFKYASHQSKKPWSTWLFRANDRFDDTVKMSKKYSISLLFPNEKDVSFGDNVTEGIKKWLSDYSKNFLIDTVDSQEIVTISDSVKKIRSEISDADISKGVLLDVMTPLIIKSNLYTYGVINALWFGDQLLNRAERLFGSMPKEVRKEGLSRWNDKKLLPWHWSYQEYKHLAKSSKGVWYLSGYTGPLWLEGDLEDVLALLALGSRLNVGSRLSASQGAFTISKEKPFLDAKVMQKEFWEDVWLRLGMDQNLPNEVFERLCRLRLETEQDAVWEADPLLDKVLGMGLLMLLKKPLKKLSRDLVARWKETLPFVPKNTEFLNAVRTVIPYIDSRVFSLVQRLYSNTVQSVSLENSSEESLWEPVADSCVFEKKPACRPWYILKPGGEVLFSNERIFVSLDSKIECIVPLEQVSMLILQGCKSVSIPLICACSLRSIPIVFTSDSGSFQNIFLPDEASLRERSDEQLRHWDAQKKSGRIGIFLLMAKIQNYVSWLEGFGQRGEELVESGHCAVNALAQIFERNKALSVARSFEKRCFSFTNSLIVVPGCTSFGRMPNRGFDPWNCLLDAASTLVYNRLCILLSGEGLSPYRGFLHCQHSRYATLAADLQELFCARTEKWLLEIVNNKDVSMKHLHKSAESDIWIFEREGWLMLFELFEQELNTKRGTDPGTWSELLEEQVERFRLWCTGQSQLTLYAGNTWWQPKS